MFKYPEIRSKPQLWKTLKKGRPILTIQVIFFSIARASTKKRGYIAVTRVRYYRPLLIFFLSDLPQAVAMPMMSNIDGSSGNSPGDLFQQIPPVSKVIIVSMVGLLFAVSIGIFSPDQYALVWPLVWNKFHAWRLLSCVLYPGSPNFFTLMQMFSIGMYSMRCEV